MRLAVLRSSYNHSYVNGLLEGAESLLRQCKAKAAADHLLIKCDNSWSALSGQEQKFAANNNAEERTIRYTVNSVPGALELPLAAKWLAQSANPPDAIVALGVVLRGETPHFDHVSTGCLQGLVQVSLDTAVPVSCGVITAESEQQAKQRSAADGHNRGYAAMRAALEMVRLKRACSGKQGTS